jgi:hypothetical protein
MEEFRDVIGYEGIYQVSNIGTVKSLRRVVTTSSGRQVTIHACIRKPVIDEFGYVRYKLNNSTKHKNIRAHNLVANAFLPEKPTKKHEPNHKNGIKTDNRVENLEWVTRSENVLHAFRIGLKVAARVRGEKHGRSKLTTKEVLEIRGLAGEYSCSIIGGLYKISKSQVSSIINRQKWTHI